MPLVVIVPDRDPLQDSISYLLTQPLIPLCRVALLSAIWTDPGPLFDNSRISVHPYFHAFEALCRTALRLWSSYKDLDSIKFKHLAAVVRMIKEERSRSEMENWLQAPGQLEGDCKVLAGEVIDLVVRIFLMVPVWSFWHDGAKGSESTLAWVSGTVSGALLRHFRPRSSEKEREVGREFERRVVLGKGFTIKACEEAGIRIVWTSSLLDHLRYLKDENTVMVFHHAAFLHYSIESNPDIYPLNLLAETQTTLSLMFPQTPETQEWFIQHQIRDHLDGQLVRCKPLTKEERNIDNFVYYKDRLTTLKRVCDAGKPNLQARPKGLRRYLSVLRK